MLLHFIFSQVLSILIGIVIILVLREIRRFRKIRYKEMCTALSEQKNRYEHELRQQLSTNELAKERLRTVNDLISAHLAHNYDKADEIFEDIIADRKHFMEATQATFAIMHPEFLAYLHSSGMTELEIECCCLYGIGMNGNEISSYLNRKSFYNVSSLIRKKLNIERSLNIDTFLKRKIQELDKENL